MADRIELSELETYLYHSADILRTHVDASDYKMYVFPLLFFKRICDVYDEETEKKKAELERLQGYDEWLDQLKADMTSSEKNLKELSKEVSGIRKKYAQELEKQMENSLKDLNFLQTILEV